jgi:uncharacterized protein YbaP (TraB family)
MGMEKLKPWLVAISIAQMAWQQAGEDPSLGIDMHFLDESKPPQRIDELETMESQFSIFAEATEEEQQSMLASILKQGDKMKDLITRMQTAYISGDPGSLEKIMQEQNDVGSKSLGKKFVDDRNVAMTGKMEEYLKGKDPVFVGWAPRTSLAIRASRNNCATRVTKWNRLRWKQSRPVIIG